MKKFIFFFVVILFLFSFLVFRLVHADEKKYDQRLTIDIYGKTLKEISDIKTEFEKLADKYNLTVIINPIPDEEKKMRDKWQKLLEKK